MAVSFGVMSILGPCICQLDITVTKIPDMNCARRGKSLLFMISGFSPGLAASTAMGLRMAMAVAESRDGVDPVVSRRKFITTTSNVIPGALALLFGDLHSKKNMCSKNTWW